VGFSWSGWVARHLVALSDGWLGSTAIISSLSYYDYYKLNKVIIFERVAKQATTRLLD
jgi:hypothetical protein